MPCPKRKFKIKRRKAIKKLRKQYKRAKPYVRGAYKGTVKVVKGVAKDIGEIKRAGSVYVPRKGMKKKKKKKKRWATSAEFDRTMFGR